MVLLHASRRVEGRGIPNPKGVFGTFLDLLLVEHGLKQADIYQRLGWSADKLSLLVRGQRSPLFRDLSPLAKALKEAGVVFSLQTLQQFLTLASQRMALQKTHKDTHADEAWEDAFRQLAEELGLLSPTPARSWHPSSAQLLETTHLIKREAWREEVLATLQERWRKKLVVLRGAPGSGKSSELSWLAVHLSRQTSAPPVQVILYDCRSLEAQTGPKAALRLLLRTLLTELGCLLPERAQCSLDQQAAFLMERLEQLSHRLIIIVDHAECALDEQGQLAVSWERFFSRLLRSAHRATLLLATRQWPGWYSGQDLFVKELALPPLSAEESVRLLPLLGLQAVPLVLLRQLAARSGGMPQALEWIAALVRRPLAEDEWKEVFVPETWTEEERLTQAVEQFLADPYPFASARADDLAPLLQRIMDNQRLSAEAQLLLEVLSLAAVPLAQPALAVVCQNGTRPIKELRRASLLTLYELRVHVNAVVASAVVRTLPPDARTAWEAILIEAYTSWLQTGLCSAQEAGRMVADLATLLLKHRRLLDAAQLLIRYGWLSFHLGYATSLARLAAEVLGQSDGQLTEADEYGGLLLHYTLAPFRGEPLDEAQRVRDYSRIRDAVLLGTVALQPPTAVSLTHVLMVYAMNVFRFEEAQDILETCCRHLASQRSSSVDLHASLLEKRAWLLGKWCEYRDEQGEADAACRLREESVALYRQCCTVLARGAEPPPLVERFLKKRQARVLNYIGYHLSKLHRHEEALQALQESLALQQQEYAEVDGLPPLYGDIAQTLLALGRFEEARHFDELAYREAERLLRAGYTFSREEIHIHRVNRACLSLRTGRVDEAEAFLREALPHIHPRRRMYTVMATRALGEIEQWREQGAATHYQLDWRYVPEYRRWASYDTYWWWAAAGPFTQAEQQEWCQWYTQPLDDPKKERLGQVIRQARTREVLLALQEQREPRFHYPALDSEQVRSHMAGFQALDARIRQDEHLPLIVRRWYHEAIAEEVVVLQLIEATAQGDSERVRALNRQLTPEPTPDEMGYALAQLRRVLIQARLQREQLQASELALEMQEAAKRVIYLLEQLGIALGLSCSAQEAEELLAEPAMTPTSAAASRLVPFQTAKQFVEAILHQAGYSGWSVIADPLSRDPHLEQALRHVYLPLRDLSVDQLKEYVGHELLDGHIARCVAGEQSLIGLLGIHLSDSLETEEALATYKERQKAVQQGRPHDESGIWFGTLAVGLAAGVITPAQRFSQLYAFFEALIYLYRLVKRPDQSAQTACARAQAIALARCLRTYRGVPDLTVAGVCYTKDVLYQRGLQKLEKALAEDPSVLDRLAVGVVALEHLPDLKELGIVAAPEPLRAAIQDLQLDESMLSFASQADESNRVE